MYIRPRHTYPFIRVCPAPVLPLVLSKQAMSRIDFSRNRLITDPMWRFSASVINTWIGQFCRFLLALHSDLNRLKVFYIELQFVPLDPQTLGGIHLA